MHRLCCIDRFCVRFSCVSQRFSDRLCALFSITLQSFWRLMAAARVGLKPRKTLAGAIKIKVRRYSGFYRATRTPSEKAIEMLSGNSRKTQSKIYPRAFFWSRKLRKIDPRASWATLAKTNGLQARLRSSPNTFLNVFGAPRNVFRVLLAAPGHPKTALGGARAHF